MSINRKCKSATICFIYLAILLLPGFIFPQTKWLQGYQKTISGGTIDYHSPQPDVTSALLVRSLDSNNFISWESQAIPKNFQGDFATFIWIFGMDVDSDPHRYELSINKRTWFQFANPTSSSVNKWIVTGPGGSELRFRVTSIDRHDDVFGYASMTVPVTLVPVGKPLTIKVTGESAGSRVWYMTFQNPVNAGINIVPQQALLRENGALKQPVEVQIIHLGSPVVASLSAPGIKKMETKLKYGFNRIPLLFPEISKSIDVPISIHVRDQKPVIKNLRLTPVRKWHVFLVQNTHTDIGYTRPQSEILPDHLRFIDYALDYCDQTDNYPDDSRFRWTCESTWAVNEYLSIRPPEQVNRLKQRVSEGRIELTGLYFNLSEMADENLLAAALKPLQLINKAGFKVSTAMQNDVNGIAWCLADYFSDTGIKYLSMGQHGHRARIPFKIPTCFWWESPSGKRILAFRADHYNTGNYWGIHTGKFASVERELLLYLKNLDARQYPFNRIAVQYSGYFTDNSPPSLIGSKVIKQWNEKYIWPKLRSATAGEFLKYVETHHSDELPVLRVAWPDWWSDGFGSSSRETAAARKAQSELIAAQGLLSLAFLQGTSLPNAAFQKTAKIEKALLFWDEHTMGAAESISDPLVENTLVQWAEKSAYAWEAVKETQLLRETAMGLLQESIPREDVPVISIFNTMNWERSGQIEVYIDHELLPQNKMVRFRDNAGNNIPAQPSRSRADGTFWYLWVEDIPPLGYKTYCIEVSDQDRLPPSSVPVNGLLENNFYKLSIDPESGAILSLIDKQVGYDLVDLESDWRIGQLIHETIANRNQLEHFYLKDYNRSAWSNLKIEKRENGAVWKSVTLSGDSNAAETGTRPECEIRLHNSTKRIEWHFSVQKKDTTKPESLYVAFPFKLPDSKIVYEAQGGEVNPMRDQLEGTSSDWHAVQNYISIRSPKAQIIISSPEIPLAHLGDLNLGKFSYRPLITKSHVFSWVMNNYWVTNFRASQRGEFKWSYLLTSSPDNTRLAAARFGWGTRIPLQARVFPAGTDKGKGPGMRSWLKISAPNLLLISSRPALTVKGIILHLREINNQDTGFSVYSLAPKTVQRTLIPVNVLEQSLGIPTKKPHIKALESRFYLLSDRDTGK